VDASLDANKDGQVDAHELLAAAADADGNGHVDHAELQDLADKAKSGVKIPTSRMGVDKSMDMNNDGKVDAEDFDFHIKRWLIVGGGIVLVVCYLVIQKHINGVERRLEVLEAYKAAHTAPDTQWGQTMAQRAMAGVNTAGVYTGMEDSRTNWARTMAERAKAGMNMDGYSSFPSETFNNKMSTEDVTGHIMAAAASIFEAADTNKDGKLSLQEIYEYMKTDEDVMACLKDTAQRDFTDDKAKEMTKDQFIKYYVKKCQ
jgi:Ca2+-binding EF-hand superfamily protein